MKTNLEHTINPYESPQFEENVDNNDNIYKIGLGNFMLGIIHYLPTLNRMHPCTEFVESSEIIKQGIIGSVVGAITYALATELIGTTLIDNGIIPYDPSFDYSSLFSLALIPIATNMVSTAYELFRKK